MVQNRHRLTKEFCDGKRLLFFPTTATEAAFIQSKIFELGYRWQESGQHVSNIDNCISKGMVVRDGAIFTGPNEESFRLGFVCFAEQFDEDYVPPPPLETQLKELAEEITAVRTMVEAIYEIVSPQVLDKARLPVKKPRLGPEGK